MTKKPSTDKLLDLLDDKYKAIHQDRDVHLEGLLHSNSITYWDYIHTDALLGLQIHAPHHKSTKRKFRYLHLKMSVINLNLWIYNRQLFSMSSYIPNF